MSFPILHTQRLDLIKIKPAHTGDMFRLFTNDQVSEFYPVMPFKNERDLLPVIEMLQKRYEEKQAIRWGIALKGSNNLIGNIGFNSFTGGHRALLAYALLPDHWNNGFITEAINAVTAFGFGELAVNRIEAEVIPGNISSEKVLEKNAFQFEGLLRQWFQWNGKHHDIKMYSLLKDNAS